MIDDSQTEKIINQYFKRENILLNHHIESYNELIDNIIPKILSQYFPLIININNDKINSIQIEIVNIHVNKPYYTENNGCSKIMTPHVARKRNYTYSISLNLDINITYNVKIILNIKQYIPRDRSRDYMNIENHPYLGKPGPPNSAANKIEVVESILPIVQKLWKVDDGI